MKQLLIHKLGAGEIITVIIIISFVTLKILPLFYGFTVIISSIIAVYFSLENFNQYWTKRNVDGPHGNALFGNIFQIIKSGQKFDIDNIEKYGKTYGTIINGTPDLITSDLDLIKDIYIKNFDAFPDRFNVFRIKFDELRANVLPSLEEDDWRRVRNKISPAFTTGKMKKLFPIMQNCSKELIQYLHTFEIHKKDVPLKDTLSKFTMNVIGRTAFAADLNCFDENEKSPFLKHAQNLLNFKSPMLYISLLFPNLADLFNRITGKSILENSSIQFFINSLSGVMNQRLNNPNSSKNYNDAFQLLLNALNDDEKPDITKDDADIIFDTLLKDEKNKKTLKKIEVLSQMFIFLGAGYETTASTLQFICYNLAYHQNIQDKLRDEIINVLHGKDVIEYDDISKLQYLNQIIQETLRMYPPGIRHNRLCQKDVIINGMNIEKGTSVTVPVYYIHHNPEIFPNPYEFNPDRFSSENKNSRHPLSYMPFGIGPRICLGMRFAEFEMKIALVELMKNFKFLPSEKMPGVPVETEVNFILRPKIDLTCKIERI